MANNFYVPKLKKIGVYHDYRSKYPKGKTGYGIRSINVVNSAIIHHTVTPRQQKASEDIKKLYNTIASKYGMIPYHFVISKHEKDGYAHVYYTGDIETIRPHAPDKRNKSGRTRPGYGNYNFVGIAFIGTFMGKGYNSHSTARPSDAQLRSAHELCKELINDGWVSNINGWGDVLGHKQAGSTACPGIWWPAKKNLLVKPPSLNKNKEKMVTIKKSEYEQLQKDSKKLKTIETECNKCKKEKDEIQKELDSKLKVIESNKNLNEQLSRELSVYKEDIKDLELKLEDLQKALDSKTLGNYSTLQLVTQLVKRFLGHGTNT